VTARVRRASQTDRAAVIDTVVSAFVTDPLVSGYFLPERFEELAPLFFGYLFDIRVDDGDVWVSNDLDSVAMWSVPGEPAMGKEQRDVLWHQVEVRLDAATNERFDSFGELMHQLKPTPPFWYLGVLATRPERQGQGLASAVVGPVLARADETHLVCCLETASAAALPVYERLGFTDRREVALADGSPLWWLERPFA
jgi:GNAT superfamily N-acetyltransferase